MPLVGLLYDVQSCLLGYTAVYCFSLVLLLSSYLQSKLNWKYIGHMLLSIFKLERSESSDLCIYKFASISDRTCDLLRANLVSYPRIPFTSLCLYIQFPLLLHYVGTIYLMSVLLTFLYFCHSFFQSN
jgi:hypothetical protein